MIARVARRALLGVLTFILTTLALYIAIRALPGTPWGDDRTQGARIEEWKRSHHLDRGLASGYLAWIEDVTTGEMGTSYSVAAGRSVTTLILDAAPTSLLLGTLGLGLALAVSIGSGLLSAWRPGGVWDRAWSALVYAVNAAPSFWLAIMLQNLFVIRMGLFHSFSAGPLDPPQGGPFTVMTSRAAYWVLPTLCLALGNLAFLFRFTRASLLDSISSPFVFAGKARGLPPSSLVGRHAFADARLHLVTWFALVVPSLIGGSVIIESIFGLPGLGRLFFNAVSSRDYPVVMGAGFVMTAGSVAGSTLADLLYQVVDPRLRSGAGRP